MSEVALEGLLYRLKSTLSLSNRRWLAEHLLEPSREAVVPYTIEKLRCRVEHGVEQIEAGHYYSAEECAQRRQQLIDHLV